MEKDNAKKLLDFIQQSPSVFHVIDNMKMQLDDAGFQELKEYQPWKIKEHGKYYTTRNGSSLIAFRVPSMDFLGYQIIASHSDSPSFKIKENPEMEVEKQYIKLNVERYGGMLYSPWMDTPLSVAGRVLVKAENRIFTRLVNIDKDLLMIPNLAIHMNRQANDGYVYNPQTDMLPLMGNIESKGEFYKLVAEAAGVEQDAIIGNDLFLYNRQIGSVWGAKDEFLSSQKLDDLECAYASLLGILAQSDSKNVCVHCVLDNEEVGSQTKQGAASTFLKDTLMRINDAAGRTKEQYYTALAGSYLISADNAHGVHPNKVDLADPTNRPYMNQGIVIKYNANQKYTTDGVSAAVLKTLCERAKIPVQTYVNRSDIAGGSTLGNLSNGQVSVNAVDIGLAQLAMHSSYETAGVKDYTYLIKLFETFFKTSIMLEENENGDVVFRL